MSVSEIYASHGGRILIPETVYAVGWNSDFIIAKQHPHDPPDGTGPNKSQTNFYILRVVDGKLFGPLSEEKFNLERSSQNLPDDLQFSLVFERLK
jgi:hypothetical protein